MCSTAVFTDTSVTCTPFIDDAYNKNNLFWCLIWASTFSGQTSVIRFLQVLFKIFSSSSSAAIVVAQESPNINFLEMKEAKEDDPAPKNTWAKWRLGAVIRVIVLTAFSIGLLKLLLECWS